MRHVLDHGLASACRDIALANERFAAKRLKRMRIESLLKQTDRILDALETLNLIDVHRVPEVARVRLAALGADLPFGYSVVIDNQLSPTQAIDLVFDIQEALLSFITGSKPDDEDLEEQAS